MSELIMREYQGVTIYQRTADRYLNATAMCKANGKQLGHYWSNISTGEFVEELSSVIGISTTELVQIRQGGIPSLQGTWVHPRVAIHLAHWISARFAVLVSGWIEELLTAGTVSLKPMSAFDMLRAQLDMLEAQEKRTAAVENKLVEVEEKISALPQKTHEAHSLAQHAVDIHSSNYGYYSVLGWARLKDISLDAKLASIHGRKLSKICKTANRPINTVRDTRWGLVNTYPEDVLQNYFDDTHDI